MNETEEVRIEPASSSDSPKRNETPAPKIEERIPADEVVKNRQTLPEPKTAEKPPPRRRVWPD